jgi:phage shock protein A
MGILSRISKVLEANLNALIERAEDPAKVLEQAIEDMKSGREEARSAIIEAKTELRLSEKRRDTARSEANEHEKKAMRALEIGDENLARKLLELKLAADSRAEAEASSLEAHGATIAQLELAEKELDRRLKEMPAKKAALLARQATAQARGARVGASSKAKDAVADAMQAFDRMEERIVRAEVEAEVRGELEPGFIDTRALEAHATDEALRSLKAKMAAQLPSGKKEEPKPAGTDAAVEDSLAALKAKLGKG